MDTDLHDAVETHLAHRAKDRPRTSWRKRLITLGIIAASIVVAPPIGWLLASLWIFVQAVQIGTAILEGPSGPERLEEVLPISPDLKVCYAVRTGALVLRSTRQMVQSASPLREPRIVAALTLSDLSHLRALRFKVQDREVRAQFPMSREQLSALVTLAKVLIDVRANLVKRALSDNIDEAVCALVHLDAENAVPRDARAAWRAIASAGRTGEPLVPALQAAADPICGALALRGLWRSNAADTDALAEAVEVLIADLPDTELGWMHAWAWSRALGDSGEQHWHRWLPVAGRETATRLHALEPLLTHFQHETLRRKVVGAGQLSLSVVDAGQLTEI